MKKYLLIIALCAAGAASRLVPHPANFTAFGAAVFCGAYFYSRRSLIISTLMLFVTDILLGFYDWRLMVVVYSSFILVGLLGILARRTKSNLSKVLALVGGSVSFYLLTNGAVWLFSPWYAKNWAGLMQSYTLALPFFRASISGDVVFAGLFFGIYALSKYGPPKLSRFTEIMTANQKAIKQTPLK